MSLNIVTLSFGIILSIMFTFSFSYQKKNENVINILENVATYPTTSRKLDGQ